ncbi:MAG: hypothetical protein AB8D78_00175 [Akkermansiaceae bacterium]
MRRDFWIITIGWSFVLAGGVLYAQDSLDDQPAPRAVPIEDLAPKFDSSGVVKSHTEQFRVSGGDAATRGTAANLAEETKMELLRLVEEKDEWKVPIDIVLVGKIGDPVPLRSTVLDIWYDDRSYKVRLLVSMSRGLRAQKFKYAVTSALVYARGLTDKEKVNTDARLSVPPWLVEGLQEATAWRLKQSDRKLYDALFQHGGLFKLTDLFAVGEADYVSIDAASKAAFTVSSGALVMALLEQPEGKKGFQDFLADMATYEGETPVLLRRHFPDLNLSQTSLAKWWALQMAAKGAAPLSEAMTVAATEEALEKALQLRYRDSEGLMHQVAFADWEKLLALPDETRADSVSLAEGDLLRLSFRCFPSYRPLLRDYQVLLKKFALNETEELSQSLNELLESREIMQGKARRARDFLDWFEITRARETSGVFDDYLSLKARLKSQPTQRKDDLSKYLDRLEPLFDVPEERGYSLGNHFGIPPF